MTAYAIVVTLLLIPVIARRAYRMGLIGMLAPRPCPPLMIDGPTAAKCCEHNPCPDRPKATKGFSTRPWRCPQCRQWWIAKSESSSWASGCGWWVWAKVSASAGDGFIEEFR